MPLASTLVVTGPYINDMHAVAISPDGRYVAYVGRNASNEKIALFVKDLGTGEVTTIMQSQGESDAPINPAFSADGRKLAFVVQTQLGHPGQIYVKDLQTGVVQTASSNSQGELANIGTGIRFDLSADGTLLTFSSRADNLVAGDNNGLSDVFVKNLTTGAVTMVSQSSNGTVGNGWNSEPQISHDGRFVLFDSRSSNLLTGYDANDPFLIKDLQTGVFRSANTQNDGTRVGIVSFTSEAMLSGNGQKVAYTATDSVSMQQYIFVKNLQSGSITIGSSDANGVPLAAYSDINAISADGRYLTFTTLSANVLPGDGDTLEDVYQKDLQTGALELLTPHIKRPSGYFEGSRGFNASEDGQHVLFDSKSVTAFGNGQVLSESNPVVKGLYVVSTQGQYSSDGANSIFGSHAADTLAGGNSDDAYWINHAGDSIIESSSAGTDIAFSMINDFTLPVNVENLRLAWAAEANVAGNGLQNGSGNDLNNRLTGNEYANTLRGMDGNDTLLGDNGNDTLEGGNGNDTLTGGSGDDMLDGGNGTDTVSYGSNASHYQISNANGTIVVISPFDDAGTDHLQNIERVLFSDKGYAFGGDNNAAQAYRIYQAAFNRTPDAGGLGFWIKQIDNGAKLTDIAQGFMQSAEFKSMYGENPGATTMAQKFYENVLHRAPDAGGLKYWVDILTQHPAAAAEVLAAFSESPENQAALVGVINAGISFTPFG